MTNITRICILALSLAVALPAAGHAAQPSEACATSSQFMVIVVTGAKRPSVLAAVVIFSWQRHRGRSYAAVTDGCVATRPGIRAVLYDYETDGTTCTATPARPTRFAHRTLRAFESLSEWVERGCLND